MRAPPHRSLVLAALLMPAAFPASAQHEGHTQSPPVPPDTTASRPAPVDTFVVPRLLFQSDMNRMTGRTPVDPMAGLAPGRWHGMAMGVFRFGYNDQGGPSGDDAVESTNWMMWMAHRSLGAGLLSLMMMNSLEPATIPEPGSPQLFQTGETFDGQPLVDYQHPHDLFMNLSATYRVALSPRAGVWLQVAAVGEPALGPTAFMHRASSGENPAAPLGHHWQDATHITNNVLTAGGGLDWLTLEASAFHGREPDEDRWNVDGGEIDSWSARARFDLSRRWSTQVSYGDLHEPEANEPGDVRRATASLDYGAAGDGPAAASLVWGRNDEEHGVSDSFLLEYAHQVTRSDHVYARVEWVEKDETLLATKQTAPDSTLAAPPADIAALTIGYFMSMELNASHNLGVGSDVTFYYVPSSLDTVYGNGPISFHLFARWRWAVPPQGHRAHHHR